MIELLRAKQASIADLCVRYGVARLDVFGSALRDDYRPGESDLDLLIDFGTMEGYQKAVAYFNILEDLQALLGVNVDLVMIGALTNPYLAKDIQQSRRLLYAA
jgi:predicted nucleotidyltransferase